MNIPNSLHDRAPALKMLWAGGVPGARRRPPHAMLASLQRNVYYFNMCYSCGTPLKYGEKPGFNDVCPTCGADMHVCRMCRFFAPGVHWDCRETVDEQVLDKVKRNHCEFFMVDDSFASRGLTGGPGKNADAKRRFNALFGD